MSVAATGSQDVRGSGFGPGWGETRYPGTPGDLGFPAQARRGPRVAGVTFHFPLIREGSPGEHRDMKGLPQSRTGPRAEAVTVRISPSSSRVAG
ncbi:hypothetical protein MMC12_003568 [Toensbergia leucococca]|nr:hypothetical protein [Toensbergia leucococca]